MIITIDGPAGAGKSTIARALAERLGFRFLDTGAMYRAATWAALQRGIEWTDLPALIDLAAEIDIQLEPSRVLVNETDCTDAIRSAEVTENVGAIADQPQIRKRMVQLQRDIVSTGDYVTEGRDQGTDAFPNADVKFYLTATPRERARRRFEQLKEQGQTADLDELLIQQNERDKRDESRPVGALRRPPGSIEIESDDLGLDEVVDVMEAHVRSAQRQRSVSS